MRDQTSQKLPALSYPLRGSGDWPLGACLFASFAAVASIISFVCLLSGYFAIYPAYKSLQEKEVHMQASSMADRMENLFTQLRDSLVSLSHNRNNSAQDILANTQNIFKDNIEIIKEIGLKKNNGQNITWLREDKQYRELREEDFLQGPYSTLQQISSLPLKVGEVTIFPAVNAYYPSSTERNQASHLSIIRLATPLPDQSGIVTIGISLEQLRSYMAGFIGPQKSSGGQIPLQPATLAYFFDAPGWILFEIAQGEHGLSEAVNVARRGFTGDFGRAGLDMTFRPWAVHENYWAMVKDIQAGAAGFMDTSARHYSKDTSNASAILCYVPVFFSPAAGGPEESIGGLALMNTSTGPYDGAQSLLMAGLKCLLLLAVLVPLLCWLLHKRFARPLYTMARDIKDMLASNDYSTIQQKPVCREHQMILAATNGLIAQTTNLQNTLSQVEGEVQTVRLSQPVDLHQIVVLEPQKFVAEYGIVGSSALIGKVRDDIKRAAKAGTDILIWGETGTGKELVAEAIHKCSTRKVGPQVSINCGALDENLLLDVLFGNTKGAFTEAKTERKGVFLTATGGTLHLDEIGTASLKVQQALLRALSVRRICPLGSDREVPFDTRVVAATNVDLRECVKEGTFREDLFYRLSIINIKTPPLRDRREDIPELAAFCLYEYANKMGKSNMQLSRGALEALTAHNWPGNVREFINCMVRAIAFTDTNLILPKHITYSDVELHKDIISHPPSSGSTSASTQPDTPQRSKQPTLQPPSKTVPAGLNERQVKVWLAAQRQGTITRAEAETIIGTEVSSRTLQLDLREMVQNGVFEKIGAGPSTRYILCQE